MGRNIAAVTNEQALFKQVTEQGSSRIAKFWRLIAEILIWLFLTSSCASEVVVVKRNAKALPDRLPILVPGQ